MNQPEREAIVAYRFEHARETLEEATVLLDAGRLRGAVNRVYYAMFYAVSALALRDGFATASHGQLRGFFNREYVKPGRLSLDFGKAYGAAFDSRTKGDYEDLVEFQQEQVRSLLKEAEEMVRQVGELLRET